MIKKREYWLVVVNSGRKQVPRGDADLTPELDTFRYFAKYSVLNNQTRVSNVA